MSCPSSGGDGRGQDSRPARVRPRFYPSGSSPRDSSPADESVLLEGETSDISEQQFAASLDAPSPELRRRFVPGPPGGRPPVQKHIENQAPSEAVVGDARVAADDSRKDIVEPLPPEPSGLQVAAEPSQLSGDLTTSAELCSGTAAEIGVSFASAADDDQRADDALAQGPQWRQEVAARLHNYHSRRTRKPPRYPSLALKFDLPTYSSSPTHPAEPPRAGAGPVPSRSEAATATAAAAEEVEELHLLPADATNIIEFPRPLVPPPPRPDELAEPILDLPRILDAPEAVPKQVPLGGIVLQPDEAAAVSDLELPLPVAPLGRRVVAAGLDGVLVLAATLMFASVANKVALLLPSARVVLGLGVALPAILWAVFQYVFLVYTGSTPGMRLTRLRLSDFDGSVPGRGTRRWRALAMALSAVSLGLGFLWCLLDEDTLCWHDRITRTYLDAGSSAAAGMRQGAMFPQRFLATLRRAETFLQRRDRETSDETGPPQH
ncbi:MAG TPA: RDD family protein [Terriglobales bacterium]|nr:RDD family protein [Terriglobales bacterium]